MAPRRRGHTIGDRRRAPDTTVQRHDRERWRWLVGGGVLILAVAVFIALEFSRPRIPHSGEMPDLPGIDVSGLDSEQRQLLVARAKDERCPCNCGFSLADCRHKDSSCPTSGPVLLRIVDEYRAGRPLEEPK